ncbi:MAG: helix-turn-helix domain-containing protein [Acutalibacteraceae bacterium]
MIDGLAERLQQMRQRYGLSQKVVADRLGISPSVVSGYETGARVPSADVLLKLASLYHCSTDYLLGKDVPTETLDVSGLSQEQFKALERLIESMRQ